MLWTSLQQQALRVKSSLLLRLPHFLAVWRLYTKLAHFMAVVGNNRHFFPIIPYEPNTRLGKS